MFYSGAIRDRQVLSSTIPQNTEEAEHQIEWFPGAHWTVILPLLRSYGPSVIDCPEAFPASYFLSCIQDTVTVWVHTDDAWAFFFFPKRSDELKMEPGLYPAAPLSVRSVFSSASITLEGDSLSFD